VFLDELRGIVGRRHVLTKSGATARFRRGYRFGDGPVLAVVRPGTLVEQWRVVEACVRAGKIVLMQAANTGLTGGSTPDGSDYDREIVIISTGRLRGIHLLGGGKQVVCLPGATLHELEGVLGRVGREPHSVIGSSCIGASVLGGISNNSGGALVRRGPAYTEMAVFARVEADGRLVLINRLGVALGEDPVEVLTRLERGDFSEGDVRWDAGRGHDDGYEARVRDVSAQTPARFNADPGQWYDASGCAGKVIVFAVRLDTFPAERGAVVFYIGANETDTLEDIRRGILSEGSALPIAGEYMHREAFDVAARYGKDTFLMIRALGTQRLPALFAAKGRIEGALARVPGVSSSLVDRVLQGVSRVFPEHLPRRMRAYRDRFAHHLMLKVSAAQAEETRGWLERFFRGREGAFFVCTADEGAKAFLHRFAAAGAAIRYRAVHRRSAGDIVALDVAYRRNARDWFEILAPEIERHVLKKLYYGHFFCHVMHQDYVTVPGVDAMALEHEMLPALDAKGARYPAEHNFGHLYEAPEEMLAHFRALDPCNCFNPGIGRAMKTRNWVAESVS